ncbi:hypothetical protein CLCR_08818 [Cladophialophora carrionii]|uniref:Protein kinase domain-containing protein n=1 Tax=Cladophialophora carrionii TaxID=86049 RepID=A0A1C1CT07_9EURO|nr:hypothetical protein CLCR_08818 [Cladophialophora carrionii]
MGKDSWSRVPRIYAVLRMIDQVQVLDAFLSQGISDMWFSFSHQTLPECLRSASARFEFLKLLRCCADKGLRPRKRRWQASSFLQSRRHLTENGGRAGKGGFGYVDRVVSTITDREYARKLIPSGKTFKKNTEVLKGFGRELTHLQKLSHIHIVELIRSYTDTKFVDILMSPVADYNLKDFLMRRNLTPGERSFLRTFFGCLVVALCSLHENKIRHKDIKPQNVLVKGRQVFLTDFGISLDWSELDQSTTPGVTTKTLRYCAPEVAGFQSRTSLSDMWSLGCVFLEIWTVLKRETQDALSGYLEKHGTQSTCYWLYYESSHEWCTLLERNLDHDDDPPAVWIRSLLQPD